MLVGGVLAELSLQLVDYPPSGFSPWIYDADTAYRYASNLDTRMTRPPEYDVAFATNSIGLRDDEVGPKHGLRILMLGDSFASGYGVERSATFPSLLEQRLGTEIVNAGVGGYELVHQAHYFDAHGAAFDADLVVLMLYLGNDLSRNAEWRETPTGGLESISRAYPTRTTREFKLGRLYRQMRYRRRLDDSARTAWTPFDDYLALCERDLSPESEQAYDTSRMLLGRLRDAVKESGAEFLVVMFSYRTTVEPEAAERLAAETEGFDRRYDLIRPAREIATYLEGEGIDYIDLIPDFFDHYRAGGEVLYFPIDGHFNPAGNAFVAQRLESALRQRLRAATAEPASSR